MLQQKSFADLIVHLAGGQRVGTGFFLKISILLGMQGLELVKFVSQSRVNFLFTKKNQRKESIHKSATLSA